MKQETVVITSTILLNGKGGEMAIGQAYNEVSIQDNIISITLKGS